MRSSVMRHTAAALLVGAQVVFLGAQAAAQTPASFYEENCAGCHTIGAAPQVGPDLKGVTKRRDRDWLIRFLLDPAAFESDPEVVRMIKAADGLTMPPIDGLTREMAEAILTLIDERSRDTVDAAVAPTGMSFTPADVERGRALFTGASRLSAAGPSCVACHNAALDSPGGGRLAPDLTGVHSRLGGSAGLTAWLGAPPTPLMRALYKSSPLTADETHALAAFFEESNAQPVARTSPMSLLAALGAGGCVLVFLASGVLWRDRFSGVRRPLVARAGLVAPANATVPERQGPPAQKDRNSGGPQ